ncbi:hypothetical protein AAV94_09625 [Lampropedia cohaerens]|uniref:Cobalamin biosynthesis protein CobD n=1 Tax=Lampropedia cohaerens TaxID=1610491 RepID=A0A0U1PYK9_9BURK|nr:hypothetical protein [Lampropedia cohaerens]KKW67609.1 hypothetical protein AAV94_09625 [Lampropedia cohaerens]
MSGLALFLALLLDQFRPLQAHHRLYASVRALLGRIQQTMDTGSPAHAWLAWAVAVAVPSLLAWGVYAALARWAGGFAAFVWMVAVAYACLEFRAFGLHFTEVRNAISLDDRPGAAAALVRWRHALTQPGAAYHEGKAATARVPMRMLAVRLSLEHMHRYVFGVFIAFLVGASLGLGPLGAVLYRAADYAYWRWHCNDCQSLSERPSPALAMVAGQGWRAVNWLPARVTALMSSLVGRYEEAFSVWRSGSGASRDPDALVLATGAVSLGQTPAWARAMAQLNLTRDATEVAPQASCQEIAAVLHEAASLIWRVLLLWLAIWLVVGLIDAVL